MYLEQTWYIIAFRPLRTWSYLISRVTAACRGVRTALIHWRSDCNSAAARRTYEDCSLHKHLPSGIPPDLHATCVAGTNWNTWSQGQQLSTTVVPAVDHCCSNGLCSIKIADICNVASQGRHTSVWNAGPKPTQNTERYPMGILCPC